MDRFFVSFLASLVGCWVSIWGVVVQTRLMYDSGFPDLFGLTPKVASALSRSEATWFGIPAFVFGACFFGLAAALAPFRSARRPRRAIAYLAAVAAVGATIAAILVAPENGAGVWPLVVFAGAAFVLSLATAERLALRASHTLDAAGMAALVGLIAIVTNAAVRPSGALPVDATAASIVSGELGDGSMPTVEMFTDYACPACRDAATVIAALKDSFSDFHVVVRHFPLDAACNTSTSKNAHPGACDAAIVAVCGQATRDQERLLYDRGATPEELRRCDGSEARRHVTDDINEGVLRGVDSTPTFFVGQQKVVGAHSYAVWALVIRKLRL